MRLRILFLGEACIDKGAVLTPGVGDGQRIHIPIPAYLIQTDDGKNILIDTGMHPNHIEDPEYTFRGQEFSKVLTPVMRAEDSIVCRLAELNLSPQDIDYVINTHLHFDHCGNNHLFTAATIYANKDHFEFARESPNFPSDLFDLPHLNYDLVEGEPEIVPGLQAILTPGHAPYHWSFMADLEEDGKILLCGDAIYCQDNLDHDAWASQMDPETARQSARKLLELAAGADATLIYGHDSNQWRSLRKAPSAFYS
jgi:N-acyl homoserine lactone hydrolase